MRFFYDEIEGMQWDNNFAGARRLLQLRDIGFQPIIMWYKGLTKHADKVTPVDILNKTSAVQWGQEIHLQYGKCVVVLDNETPETAIPPYNNPNLDRNIKNCANALDWIRYGSPDCLYGLWHTCPPNLGSANVPPGQADSYYAKCKPLIDKVDLGVSELYTYGTQQQWKENFALHLSLAAKYPHNKLAELCTSHQADNSPLSGSQMLEQITMCKMAGYWGLSIWPGVGVVTTEQIEAFKIAYKAFGEEWNTL